MKIPKIEILQTPLSKIIEKIVYETRTCPIDIGLINTYPKCDGSQPTEKAEKCIKCFKYAIIDSTKNSKIRL